MTKHDNKPPDFMALYERYQQLKPGPKAELKRVVNPADLIEIPAFYRLLQGTRITPLMQRLVFCLPPVTHVPEGDSLGQALAKAGINEKRLFMVIRSQEPNDLIQLRRILKQANPVVDWQKMAKILFWNDSDKRQLLEDFFYYQTNAKTKATA